MSGRKQWIVPGYGQSNETDVRQPILPGYGQLEENPWVEADVAIVQLTSLSTPVAGAVKMRVRGKFVT